MHVLRRIPYWCATALLAYMPFHIFLSQSLSLVTGGLEVWKLGKDAALLGGVAFTICLVLWKRRGSRLFFWMLGLGVAYLLLHVVLWALHPGIYRNSALLGIIYNMRVIGYAILGLGAGILLQPKELRLDTITKIVLGVSTVVAILGVAQYFLPHNILAHLGYGVNRGTLPAFFIDNKPNFPRIMSTLRDPNSLGAYLILPLIALTALLLRAQAARRRLQLAALLAVHGTALFLTFSRGAWAAALLAEVLLLVWRYAALGKTLIRRFWPVAAAAAVLALVGLASVRNTYVIKSVITHSTGAPQGAAYDSNGFHWYFAKQGLGGIVHEPLGHGPGTAGLASIQNPKGSFLTENYYIQLGYEVGIVGLLLFVAMNVLIYVALWRRQHGLLVSALICSFWAYVVMNMLFHMWSNEAVAAQWWIVAGLVLGLGAQPGKTANGKDAS